MSKKMDIQLAMQNGASTQDIHDYLQNNPDVEPDLSGMKQNTILEKPTSTTENFGDYMPGLEPTPDGRTRGTGFRADIGTKVALPSGRWQVADSYTNASGQGHKGDMTNQGYGNSALMRNMDTGEWMRYSHLSANFVKPGQVLDGNTVIGATGATGNVTGPHLHLEYYNQNGQLGDVMQSQYAQSLSPQGQ